MSEEQLKELIINYIQSVPFHNKDNFFFMHDLNNYTQIASNDTQKNDIPLLSKEKRYSLIKSKEEILKN